MSSLQKNSLQSKKSKPKRQRKLSDYQISDSEQIYSSHEEEKLMKKRKQKKIKIKKSKEYKNMNHSQWTFDEEFMFLEFMKKNQISFACKVKRREDKVFKKMATIIRTRSAEQCRSHHQKYEQKCLSYANIIELLTHKLEEEKNRMEEKPPENFVHPYPNTKLKSTNMAFRSEQIEAGPERKKNPANQNSTSYSNRKTEAYVKEELDSTDFSHRIMRMVGSYDIKIILNLKHFFGQ